VLWLTPLPDPVAGPHAPKPHLCSRHFGLPALALGGQPRELRAPRFLLNQGPPEPCYATAETAWVRMRDVSENTKLLEKSDNIKV